jgi:hypothetical protein
VVMRLVLRGRGAVASMRAGLFVRKFIVYSTIKREALALISPPVSQAPPYNPYVPTTRTYSYGPKRLGILSALLYTSL